MLSRIINGIAALCAVLLEISSASGAKPTFAELLARAKSEAAAGHRLEPPGDNVADTAMQMLDLAPTATPAQIAEFTRLLQPDPPAPISAASGLGANPPVVPHGTIPSSPVGLLATTRAATSPIANIPSATNPSALLPDAITNAGKPHAAVPGTAASNLAIPSPIATGGGGLGAKPGPPPELGSTARGATISTPSVSAAASPGAALLAGVTPKAASQAAKPSNAYATELYVRGQAAEQRGDISGARRFYTAAAQHDLASAARALGQLYDPIYLQQATLGGIDSNTALAEQWYERATAMGDPEAASLRQALSSR